jgi:hypothetical protein
MTMKFNKAYIEDQFRGFEIAKDNGNNVVAVRVKKNDEVIAVWKVLDSRLLDSVVEQAINIAITHQIVHENTV